MGEIIRPDFGRRKKEEPKEPDEEAKIQITNLPAKMTPAEMAVTESAFEVAYGEDKGPFLLEYMELAFSDKIKKLSNLKASQAAITQARSIVKDYTTENLLGWLKKSTEIDWQTRAGFFQAMLAELKMRMKI
ncbi:MAG: hypothetical protein NTX82_06195 [Candidatus Parcubacteria bacterium]|nr:hypothetical protein [Candidatus Parcubacteria bacterium]